MDEPHGLIVPVVLGDIGEGVIPRRFNGLVGHLNRHLAVGLPEGVGAIRPRRHLHGLAVAVGHGDLIHLIALVRVGGDGHGVAPLRAGGVDRNRAALLGLGHVRLVGGRSVAPAAGAIAALGPRDFKVDGQPSDIRGVSVRRPEDHGVGPHLGGRLSTLIGGAQPAGIGDLQLRRHRIAAAVLNN